MSFSLSSGSLYVQRTTVGTTAASVATFYRRSQPFEITVKNNGTSAVYLGNSNAVNSGNGYPLRPAEVMTFTVPAGVGELGASNEVEPEELFAVSTASGQGVAVFIPPLPPTIY